MKSSQNKGKTMKNLHIQLAKNDVSYLTRIMLLLSQNQVALIKLEFNELDLFLTLRECDDFLLKQLEKLAHTKSVTLQ